MAHIIRESFGSIIFISNLKNVWKGNSNAMTVKYQTQKALFYETFIASQSIPTENDLEDFDKGIWKARCKKRKIDGSLCCCLLLHQDIF